MILPDVNLLLYAHDRRSRYHAAAHRWWSDVLSGDELTALTWVTLLGFIRIITSRAIFEHPLSVDEALALMDGWLAQPNARIVEPTHRHAEVLAGFLRGIDTAGNLTTDAHLAALAIEHGCTLYSTDVDFGRFPGLRWRNPLVR